MESESTKPKIVFVKLDHVHGQLLCDDPHVLEAAIKKFSIPVENYWFMPAYKAGRWDGKIRFINFDGTFYNGIFHRILKYVKNDDIYDVVIDPHYELDKNTDELKRDFFKVTEETLNSNMVPYVHQFRGALKSLYFGRGICEHVTSSGKSLTISLTVNYLYQKDKNSKILILVPKLDLIEQFAENLVTYGIDSSLIGKFCGYQKDTEQPFIVSTWQSMHKQKELLKQFNVLIADECHGLKADVVRSVTEKMVNANIRLGFTGTMPDSKSDYMLVEGVLGPIIDKVGYTELQEANQISDIDITVVNINYPESITTKMVFDDFTAEKDFIEGDIKRNKIICKIAHEYTKKDMNVLILVKKIDHSKVLFDILDEMEVDVEVVTGETKITDRNNIRRDVEKTGGTVIVATVGVYSTGVSINRLHTVIFASAGKSKIQTLQSVGRGLRLHTTKKILNLYDFCENLKFSQQHARKRIKYYETNNFKVRKKDININA